MPFNGSGVFQRVRNWVADATAGVKIRADYHDAEDDGFAAGLSNCITKDGQTTVTQNIPFSNKRITGLADPVNAQDASTKAYTDTKIPTVGGVPMTGDLTIKKDSPTLVLDTNAGGSSNITGMEGGKVRWIMRLGNDAVETGANVGSDFDLLRYADDGATFLGQPLLFNRASGLGTVAADPTAALGIATKQYVDTTINTAASPKVNRAGDTLTGELVTVTATQAIGGPSAMGTIQVRGAQPGITFHSPGTFAANFGMSTDGNFYMGGWSHGNVAYKFWTTRDFASLPLPPSNIVTGTRLSYAGDFAHTAVGVTEPYVGAVTTGGSPTVSGAYYFSRYRWLQVLVDGNWTTVGVA